MKEEASEKGKTGWADFKRRVWHDAMKEIIAPLVELSKTGLLIRCGDGVERRVFPVLNILSGDYEEQ